MQTHYPFKTRLRIKIYLIYLLTLIINQLKQQSMRKNLTTKVGLSLLLMFVFSFLGTSTAKALDLTVGKGFTPVCQTDYTISTETGGTLSLSITDSSDNGLFWYWMPTPLLSLDGNDVAPTYANATADSFSPATELEWTLEGGKTYIFNIAADKTAAELGTYTFAYSGTLAGGSDPEPDPEPVDPYVVSISPEADQTAQLDVNGNLTFTVSFNTPVKFNKYDYRIGRNYYAPEMSNPGNAEYSAIWTILVPKSGLDQLIAGMNPEDFENWYNDYGNYPSINVILQAVNSVGTVATYKNSEWIDIYYYLTIPSVFGVDYTVNVDSKANGSLSTFTVSPLEGYSYVDANDHNYPVSDNENDGTFNYFKEITIEGPNGFKANAVSYYLPKEEVPDDPNAEDGSTGDENGDTSHEVITSGTGTVTFSPAITESGDYTITLPYRAFSISAAESEGGEGDLTYWSQEKTVEFTITIGENEPAEELDLDVAYTVPVTGQFTASESGTLNVNFTTNGKPVEWASGASVLFSDPDFKNEIDWINYNYQDQQQYAVVEGTVYYLNVPATVCDGMNYSSVEVTLSMAKQVEASSEPMVFDQEVATSPNVKYTFTPTEDGVFKAEADHTLGTFEGNLYTADGQEVEVVNTDGYFSGVMFMGYSYSTYNVKADTEYYFMYTNAGGEASVNFTFTMEESVLDDSDYEELELTTYTPTTFGSIKLKITPEADGTLTATQTGTEDSHLYPSIPVANDPANDVVDYNRILSPNPMPAPYENENTTNVYNLPYNLEAGKTYYFFAKNTDGDALKSVTFTWEQTGELEEIELGKPYTVDSNSPVMVYTAAADGILTVEWSDPASGEDHAGAFDTSIAEGQVQNFLFSKSGHNVSDRVPALEVYNGDDGYVADFQVTEGTSYYLYLASLKPFTAVFTYNEGNVTPAIAKIEPVPGTAYDATNFGYYFNIITKPNLGSVEKVNISYTGTDGVVVNEPVEGAEFGGDALRIPTDVIVNAVNNQLLEEGTYFTITLVGLKAAGQYVEENLMTEGANFVEIGENGNVVIRYTYGKPVTLEKDVLPSPFLQWWAPGSADAIATLTFSGDIKAETDYEVSVSEGHIVPGAVNGGEDELASVVIPKDNISIEGNKLIINFAGVDMTSINEGQATVLVTGLQGTNGLYVQYGGQELYTGYVTMTKAEVPANTVKAITPANNTNIEANDEGELTFTIEFNSEAKITSAYTRVGNPRDPKTMKEWSLSDFTVSNADNAAYSTTWSVTFPSDYVLEMTKEEEPNVWVNLSAQTQNGQAIGYGENEDVIAVYYNIVGNIPGVDFDVIVNEAAAQLDNFMVAPLDGYTTIAPFYGVVNGAYTYNNITITGPNDFKATVVEDAFTNGYVAFSPAITEAGEYTITFPFHSFDVSTEGDEDSLTGSSAATMAKTYTFNFEPVSELSARVAFGGPEEAILGAVVYDPAGVEMDLSAGIAAFKYVVGDHLSVVPAEGAYVEKVYVEMNEDLEVETAIGANGETLIELTSDLANQVIIVDFALEGTVNPEPTYNATLAFSGPEEALSQFQVSAASTDEILTPENGLLAVTYEGSATYKVVIPAPWVAEVSCGDLLAGDDTYKFETSTDEYDLNVTLITLYAGVDGKYVDVEFFNPEADGNYSATLAFSGEEAALASFKVYEIGAEDTELTPENGLLTVTYENEASYKVVVDGYDVVVSEADGVEVSTSDGVTIITLYPAANGAFIDVEFKAPSMTTPMTLVTPEQDVVSSVWFADVTWGYENIQLTDNVGVQLFVNDELISDELNVQLIHFDPNAGEGGVSPAAEGDDADGDVEAYNVLNIEMPMEAMGLKGEYVIRVLAGSVENAEGMVNVDSKVSFLVVDNWTGETVLTPEVENYGSLTVASLPTVKIEFPNAMGVSINEPVDIRINETVINGEATPIMEGDNVVGYEFNVADLTADDGEYALIIPQDAFLINGVDGKLYLNGPEEIYVTYVVSKGAGIINVVDALDGKYVVYNMNGVKLLDTENAAELSLLEPGLYIINGKKVLVRK